MDALTQGAAHCRCAPTRRWATDWLNGRRSPFADSSLTGTLTGLNLSTSAPEIYYAFAEATAFATKHILDHMRDNGVRIDRLIGVGGIAQKSPFVMQLLADTDRYADSTSRTANRPERWGRWFTRLPSRDSTLRSPKRSRRSAPPRRAATCPTCRGRQC